MKNGFRLENEAQSRAHGQVSTGISPIQPALQGFDPPSQPRGGTTE
ncbi:hypothetical protein RBWH47_03473 [Rhodopirellula baltica WH47]|uniref:Uncharacterized protein n=1 Tax=Rhodopirellula baltica WH47 TaxID=991778 RepID=F2ALM5_RHOBT|nr:hypothetical protein RBWH47_03473 [Rhodopirellula baltica WH47]